MSPEDIGRYIQEFLEYARPLYEATQAYVIASTLAFLAMWTIIAVISFFVVRWAYRYARIHWNDNDDHAMNSDSFVSTVMGATVCGLFGALSIPAIVGYVVVIISRDYYTVKTLLALFMKQ